MMLRQYGFLSRTFPSFLISNSTPVKITSEQSRVSLDFR